MVSLFLQGFAMLAVAFVIGLPLGHLLAKRVRRWTAPRQIDTERVLDVAAIDMTARAEAEHSRFISAPSVLPWSETVTYPVSDFARATLSARPERR